MACSASIPPRAVPDDRREELLTLLADLAGVALKNAFLYQKANRVRQTLTEALAVVFRQAPEGLLLLDQDRRVNLANPAALHLLGLEEIPPNTGIIELLRVAQLSFSSAPGLPFLDRFLPDEGLAGLSLHAGLTDRDLVLSVYSIGDESGAYDGTVVLLHDATSEKREAKLQEDFLSTAAHELRAPMAAISSYVQLLQRPDYAQHPERVRQAYEVIARNVGRMDQICRDLLNLSRLITGSFSLNLAPLDLDVLARNAAEEMEPLFAEIGASLGADLGSAGGLLGDRVRLAQVLANLLGNALKFTRPGGTVILRTWRETGAVCCQVKDDGPGIPQDKLAEIFKPFCRIRQSEGVGLGLGLAIAKGIVEAHGGSITAWSEPGKGAAFTVLLPAR